MADEILIFDKAGSNVDGTDPGSPLSVGPGTNYNLVSYSYPAPPLAVLYSSSIDTEGELPVTQRHQNRVINLEFELAVDATDAVLKTLQGKFAKLQQWGGTLHRTMKNGDVRIYDIVAADGFDPTYDFAYVLADMAHVTMTLPAAPYARGTEADLGDNTEFNLPALVFTEAGVAGDVPALGRLVIDEDGAADQWWVTWGLQCQNYSSAATAALFYEAEGRTGLSGSTAVAGPAGASGAGSNVMRNTGLTGSYQAVLGTQATGGGAHLTHVGSFRVYARVQIPASNSGTVTIRLDWGEADYRAPSSNTSVTIPDSLRGTWLLQDMGLVTLSKVATGAQRWEGRILANSTFVGDDIDIDSLFLIPGDEGYGVVQAVSRSTTPTSLVARDEFAHATGGLAAKVAPLGGTWSGAGDADDVLVDGTLSQVYRAAMSDAGYTSGRFELFGTTTYAAIEVHSQVKQQGGPQTGAGNPAMGILLRYVDTNNWAALVRSNNAGVTGSAYLCLLTTVAGNVAFTFARDSAGSTVSFTELAAVGAGTSSEFGISVSVSGQFAMMINGIVRYQGTVPALATGGALASGRIGLYDYNPYSVFGTRFWDNFYAFVPTSDAAVFANQSLEVRHDLVQREDSTGTIWTRPSSYTGKYLRVPQAGAEARTNRLIVKASRSAPGAGSDSNIDDISARLFVTPRYL